MDANNEKINTITDLYKRVLPALKTKTSDLKRENFPFIKELDIWNYCIDNKWKHKKDLRIYEMVDDILNLEALKIEIYIRKKLIDRNEENER